MTEDKVYINGVEIGTVEDFNIYAKGVSSSEAPKQQAVKQPIPTSVPEESETDSLPF